MDENKNKHIEPWDRDSYETGSTHPPKNQNGLVAVLLIAVILLGGISSVLGVLNIKLFRELEQSGHRTVVVFCHEGTLRSLYNYVKKLPAGQRIPCKNGGVCRFAWDGTAWTVEAWEL